MNWALHYRGYPLEKTVEVTLISEDSTHLRITIVHVKECLSLPAALWIPELDDLKVDINRICRLFVEISLIEACMPMNALICVSKHS